MPGIAYLWRKRSPAEWTRLLKEAGEQGMAVTETAAFLGISQATFALWERRYPEFREATKKVRENSAARALARTERLLAKSEERLVAALAHVRQKKAEERARIDAAMAAGLIWTPEQLAAKIRNLKELRNEARREERARQRKSAAAVTVRLTGF